MSGQKHSFQLNGFLDHILEAIHRIEDYTSSLGYAEFCRSTRDQDAVIRNFEIIGEASRNIAQNFPEFVTAHPELPIRSALAAPRAVVRCYGCHGQPPHRNEGEDAS